MTASQPIRQTPPEPAAARFVNPLPAVAPSRTMTAPGAFADVQALTGLAGLRWPLAMSWRTVLSPTPTCSGSHWSCGAAPIATPAPAWTFACTAAPRCRWAGSTAMSWYARITGGGTGPTAAVRPFLSWKTPARVPAKARIPVFRCQERYGLIWVSLEEPRWPLPDVPEVEDGSWAVLTAGPYRWQCDAARQVENFTDFGHFPWVHPGLLGDPDRPGAAASPGQYRRQRPPLSDCETGGGQQ